MTFVPALLFSYTISDLKPGQTIYYKAYTRDDCYVNEGNGLHSLPVSLDVELIIKKKGYDTLNYIF